VNLLGSSIRFARTKAEREASKDSRLSIQERYRDEGDYFARLRVAAEEPVKARGRLQWEFVTGQMTPSSR